METVSLMRFVTCNSRNFRINVQTEKLFSVHLSLAIGQNVEESPQLKFNLTMRKH